MKYKIILFIFFLLCTGKTYSQNKNYEIVKKNKYYVQLIVNDTVKDDLGVNKIFIKTRHRKIKIINNFIVTIGIRLSKYDDINSLYLKIGIHIVENNKFKNAYLKIYTKDNCITEKLRFYFKENEIICKFKKNIFSKAKFLRSIKYSEIEKLKEITLSCQ